MTPSRLCSHTCGRSTNPLSADFPAVCRSAGCTQACVDVMRSLGAVNVPSEQVLLQSFVCLLQTRPLRSYWLVQTSSAGLICSRILGACTGSACMLCPAGHAAQGPPQRIRCHAIQATLGWHKGALVTDAQSPIACLRTLQRALLMQEAGRQQQVSHSAGPSSRAPEAGQGLQPPPGKALIGWRLTLTSPGAAEPAAHELLAQLPGTACAVTRLPWLGHAAAAQVLRGHACGPERQSALPDA